MVSKEEVLRSLASVKDPETGRDLVTSGFVKEVRLTGDSVEVLLVPRNPAPERIQYFRKEVASALSNISNKVSVEFTLAPQEKKMTGLEGIKNVVAIASGKGGVGKSTVAIYTALALAERGLKVGLLDADIYGASAHLMLRSDQPMQSRDNRLIPPLIRGVKMMSMGYFTQTENPVIWRGPLVGKAVRDFVELTDWGELDFLIVDLPPGCISKGTPVLTADGKEVPVEGLYPGSRVLSYYAGRLLPAQVENVLPQGLTRVFRISADGRSMVASGNHPFLTRIGDSFEWRRLDQIKKGDMVVGITEKVADNGQGLQTVENGLVQPEVFEVDSVTEAGVTETFDLMLNGDHTFVAGGFVVHNTGDAPLTLAQTLPVSGIVLVTTPQEAASRVAAKSYYMFKRLGVPIVGVVENMSYFECPHCGKRTNIFGQGGGRKLANELGVDFLGEIPLVPSLTVSGDAGVPLNPDQATLSFKDLATKLISYVESERAGETTNPDDV